MAHATRQLVVSGLTWHLDPDAADGPLGRMLTLGQDPRELEHTVVKSNPHRRVLRIERNGAVFFIKHHFCSTPLARLRSLLLVSRAKAEWDALCRVRALGFDVPASVAYAQGPSGSGRDSVIITGALTQARNLRESLEALDAQRRLELSRSLGARIRALHEGGVYHRDMQPGNIFVEPVESGFKFYFLDLHKALFSTRVSRRRRAGDLAQLVFNLTLFCAPEEIDALLSSYADDESQPHFAQCVKQRAQKLKALRKCSRAKRCLKNSSQFTVERLQNFRIYHRREIPAEEIISIVDGCYRFAADIHIRTISAGPCRLAMHIKEVKSGGFWQNFKDLFQRPRGRRAWQAANALVVRGIPTPRPLALVEEMLTGLLRRSYLITEFVLSGQTLAEYVHSNFVLRRPAPSEVNTVVRKLAEALAALYREGIYHSDLKASNILVKREAGGSIQLYFTDFDGIHLWRKPSLSRVIKNLVQLYCSLPFCVGRPAAARFFLHFLRETGLGPNLRTRLDEIARRAEARRRRWISVVRRYGKIL